MAAPSASERGSSRCEPPWATPNGRITTDATHIASASPIPPANALPHPAFTMMYVPHEGAGEEGEADTRARSGCWCRPG